FWIPSSILRIPEADSGMNQVDIAAAKSSAGIFMPSAAEQIALASGTKLPRSLLFNILALAAITITGFRS
ncbi:hypothetical protein, partial [Termitidicoccus mucosus]|uniref:hypothetical protein n=1 Tax=Termitidicoccus mucosus TaxID=1184151 RepID=UPI002FEDFC3C